MTTLSREEIEYYVNALREIISESETANRPPLGSWVKSRLLVRQPDFDEGRWGYSTFKNFIADLPDVVYRQDGPDIVIGISANPRPQPSSTHASFSHLGSVEPDLWRAFCRPPESPPAFLDRTALQQGSVHIEYGSPIAVEHENRFRTDTVRYLEIPHSDIGTQTPWLKTWITTHIEEPERSDVLHLLSSEDGFRRAVYQLRKLGRDRDWFRFRATKTQELLREWLGENHIPWTKPIVSFRKQLSKDTLPARSDGEFSPKSIRQLADRVIRHIPESQLRNLTVPLGAVWDALLAREDIS